MANRQHFHKVFGISYKMFNRIVMSAESKCLSLILSYLETLTLEEAGTFVASFDDGVLIQNMDNNPQSTNFQN